MNGSFIPTSSRHPRLRDFKEEEEKRMQSREIPSRYERDIVHNDSQQLCLPADEKPVKISHISEGLLADDGC